MKRAERLDIAEHQMRLALARGGADFDIEIIRRPVVSKGRVRGIWARFTGRDIELIARRAVR